MKTATVADLRNNFRRLSDWLEHGETVQILKRGKPYAQLTAIVPEAKPMHVPKVDWMAQLKETWGDRRPFTMEEVEEMRALEHGEKECGF